MDHQINASIQIIPIAKSQDTYGLIDRAIAVIQDSGLDYEVTPMDTVIAGPYDKVFAVIKKAQQVTLEAGADEIAVNIKIHIKKDSDVNFKDKTLKFKA